MKLLFVVYFDGFAGGIERYMYQAAELMRERGHRIYGLFEMPGKDQNEFCKVFESTHFLDALDSVPEDIDIAIIHKIREPEALSAITACSMPSLTSSHAVRREPWLRGRVSSA